jgi:putative pyruvate formate lyase activating enzyme
VALLADINIGYNKSMTDTISDGIRASANDCTPAAVALQARGELQARAQELHERLRSCDLCPHHCRVNRLTGQPGRCGVGADVRIASVCAHMGEEPALSGEHGAGAVFMAGCNLRCLYCQNHQISQQGVEDYPVYDAATLAEAFLDLQRRGCHNLDWVSPTHVVPQLVAALALAIPQGFRLPIVYNSNGYDSVETLRLLEGIVDIYLPDFKYVDDEIATRLSGAPGYADIALAAIREMYRQVGDLALDDQGMAYRGVIVRHLVLPNGLSGTRQALLRLADEVSPTLTVSLMAQYYPTYRAAEVAALTRVITEDEYDDALAAFADAGLENGWAQELLQAPDNYRPDFTADKPFEMI